MCEDWKAGKEVTWPDCKYFSAQPDARYQNLFCFNKMYTNICEEVIVYEDNDLQTITRTV